MNRSRYSHVFGVVLAVAVFGGVPGHAADDATFVPVLIKGAPAHPTRLLAKVKPVAKASAHAFVLATQGMQTVRGFDLVPGLVVIDANPQIPAMAAASSGTRDADIRAEQLQTRIDALRASGLFEFVEPDFIWSPFDAPGDARFVDGSLWGLHNTGQDAGLAGVDLDAVRAWDITTGSPQVIVAVIDTGIFQAHEDLATQMWRNPGETPGNGIDDDGNGYVDDVFGIDAMANSGNPTDELGHGTHVAGTIGAAANNGHPMVGVAWQVRLMACRFMGEQGGLTSDAIECINYAVTNGARVLNCSWGGARADQALRAAFAAAHAQGVLVVAAAGNSNANTDIYPTFPAGYDLDNIISVAAIDRRGERAVFTNSGAGSVDLGAPGVAIFSTLNYASGYGFADGTSMAAPHVAGVAALLLAQNPTLSMGDLRDRIVNTAVPTASLADYTVSGGRVSAYAALTETPDGRLELTLQPPGLGTVFGGRTVTVFAHVTDLVGVTGATVTGQANGGTSFAFRDDGVAPDLTAGDAYYTATIPVPMPPIGGVPFLITVNAAAPGKTDASAERLFYAIAPPGNDHFVDRRTLTGKEDGESISSVGATAEPGEPEHAGRPGGASVWWTWTAPADTNVTIETRYSFPDTLLAVYTGNSVSALTTVAANDDAVPGEHHSRVEFNATAGTAYQIAVDGFEGETGTVTVRLSTAIVSANDMFANAVPITGSAASITGNLYNATRETGEPNHGWATPGGSVWWSWTPPTSGTAVFTTTGGLLGVYTGNAVNALTPVPGSPGGTVTFAAASGTVYRIAVATDEHSNPVADFTVGLTLSSGPANDAFADRIPLAGTDITTNGDTTNATIEAGESAQGNGGSLWWTWTAPANGTIVLTLDRPSHDNSLTVYTGSSIAGLTTIASNAGVWSNPSGFSRATSPVTAGMVCQIAVAGRSGPLSFRLQLLDGPVNDNFANRTTITGSALTVVGNTLGGSRESGEPVPTPYGTGGTIWWNWVPPHAGTARASITTGHLAVYTGDALDTLVPVTFGPIATSVVFRVEAGVAYQLWVDGIFGYAGEIRVTMSLVDGPPNDLFSDRLTISGPRANVTGTTANATVESDLGVAVGPSVWWTWTAPATGRTQITRPGRGGPIEVATGEAVGNLTWLPNVYTQSSRFGAIIFDAVAGTTYQIVAGGDNAADAPSFPLRLVQAPAPANDAFASRVTIVGPDVVVTATNEGASFESYEPDHGSSYSLASVWWTWTAPASGAVEINTAASDFDTKLGVYTGTSISNLTTVATNNDDPAGGNTSRVYFTAVAGTVYQVAVDGHAFATGQIALRLRQPPVPANDSFAHRLVVTGALLDIAGDNLGAGREPGEPDIGQFTTAESTVWWAWTAPATGTAMVSVEDAVFDPLLRVYTGSVLQALTPVTNFAYQWDSRRSVFRAQAGATYQIAVGAYPYRFIPAGRFTLAISLLNAPANDDFANRTPLVGASVSATGTTIGASPEPGEPEHAMLPVDCSVWWSWSAPTTGGFTVNLLGTEPGAVLGIYTGSAVNALTLVANSAETVTGNTITLAAIAGTSYQIAIAHLEGGNGDVNLSIYPPGRPGNDDFSAATPLTGVAAAVTGTNRGATMETGEPEHATPGAGSSVWWMWTAPLGGPFAVSTAGSGFNTTLAVYTVSAVETLTLVASNNDAQPGVRSSLVSLPAFQGTTYWIAVAGTRRAMGDIALAIAPAEPPRAYAIEASASEIGADGSVMLTADTTGSGPFTYQWMLDGVAIPGATEATLIIPSVQAFHSGVYTVHVMTPFGSSTSPTTALAVTEPPPSDARLTNLSTRALCLTADNVLIPGFVVTGPGTKQVLIRAVGPTLADFGVPGTLLDPRLTLKRWNGVAYEDVAANDDWGNNPNAAEIITKSDELFAFPLAAGSADAALLVDLAPGQYSAVTSGVGPQTGIAIVELYDADTNGGTARLINISNRGHVGAGDFVMIPGYVISNEGPKTLLIRAVGPALAQFGVIGVLADPTLTIYRRVNNTEEEILTNDDWSIGPGAQRTREVAVQVQAFALPEGSKDAAFVVTLNPGVYTVHARGANNTTGVALVEVYAVP